MTDHGKAQADGASYKGWTLIHPQKVHTSTVSRRGDLIHIEEDDGDNHMSMSLSEARRLGELLLHLTRELALPAPHGGPEVGDGEGK